MILLRHGQSEFNVLYSTTRVDPGIRDPGLTAEGRRQADEAGRALKPLGIRRIVVSPYTRTLQTAAIIAGHVEAPVSVDPVVGERAAFSCDVGTPRSHLARQWPQLALDHLDEQWWPTLEETEAQLRRRCARFHSHAVRQDDRHAVLVVTHWGFIRGMTGQEMRNAAWLRYDFSPGPLFDLLPAQTG